MKRRLVHVFELRQYSDLSWHIKEPQNCIYCLNFFKNDSLKAEGPETLFHTRSNLLGLLCRCVVSFLFALRCIFHCVRTCVVRERHCLSVMATVTKEGGSLRTVDYSSTSLWHSVNIFPENFNTNVITLLLQLKPKAFLWMYNRSVQFIFQLAPNLLDGVEVWTLRGPVHNFQCSAGSFHRR